MTQQLGRIQVEDQIQSGGRLIPWMENDVLTWKYMPAFSDWKPKTLPARPYVCGHCGVEVAPNVGFACTRYADLLMFQNQEAYIYICHNCHRPTLAMPFEPMIPAPRAGEPIAELKGDVAKLYEEIRSSMQAGAYTGAVALCRTMIAHVSHEKTSKAKDAAFQDHLKALYDSEHLAKGQRDWIDAIKDSAGKGIHDLEILSPDEAKSIFEFTQMMLKILYTYPAIMPAPRPNNKK
jgi:hypothetical protein